MLLRLETYSAFQCRRMSISDARVTTLRTRSTRQPYFSLAPLDIFFFSFFFFHLYFVSFYLIFAGNITGGESTYGRCVLTRDSTERPGSQPPVCPYFMARKDTHCNGQSVALNPNGALFADKNRKQKKEKTRRTKKNFSDLQQCAQQWAFMGISSVPAKKR